MKVDDRSAIAELMINQLWEQDYFSTIPIRSVDGQDVTIISTGVKNKDAALILKESLSK